MLDKRKLVIFVRSKVLFIYLLTTTATQNKMSTTCTNDELLENQHKELIFKADNKYVLTVPKGYEDVWALYKKQEGTVWKREEVDIEGDIVEWKKLDEDKRDFIKMILAFFAAADGIVNENISVNFANEVQISCIRAYYSCQNFIETVHCVTGDTRILTDNGYVSIGSVADTDQNIWNGHDFSLVKIKDTGKSPIKKVTLSNGMSLKCTPGHKWLIHDQDKRVETQNLTIGDTLQLYDLPLVKEGSNKFKTPYISGFFHKQETTVPIGESVYNKLRWFEGVCDSDACVSHETFSDIVVEGGTPFLCDTQLMLTTLGVLSTVLDGMLLVSNFEVEKLIDLGFKPHSLVYVGEKFPQEIKHKVTVVSIEHVSDLEDTYCFSEPKYATGIFNGILTGQSETYSALIESYIEDEAERDRYFHALENFSCITQKAEWAQKWMNPEIPFALRLIAFAVVEGVFFSGAFCSIFWLKDQNINLKGLFSANEFISRDENLHCCAAVTIFKKLKYIPNEKIVHDLFKDAVMHEIDFITVALPVKMIGMNSDLMSEYIKFVADRLLLQLGYNRLYNVKNPFDFMEKIGMDNISNFHTRRVTEYARSDKIVKIKGASDFDTSGDDF
jgi:ribonucleotide reductase beta subunit family protein with ferritin-like domain